MRAALVSIALLALAGTSCSSGAAAPGAAVAEPVQVESAQFVVGSLPGASPTTDAAVGPSVADVEPTTTVISPGQRGIDFLGHATPDAQTVALRFANEGSGYWVVPVSGPDPAANNYLTWQLTADFAKNLAPGPHTLLFAGIGANGASGAQLAVPFCVDTPVPDNLNACLPKRTPPAAVLSLSWDAPVDLDLVVRVPGGALVGGKKYTPAGATSPVLDRDSNRA